MIPSDVEQTLIVGRVVSLLRPGARFSISNGDRSTLVFLDEGVAPVSDEEYAQGFAQYEAQKAAYEQEQEAAKVAAEAKLAALGLTTEDLKALLS